MDLLNGLLYNIRGLRLGLTTGILFFWGLVRFALVIIVMLVLTGLILSHHGEIMDLLWTKPQNPWILWLWHLLSWLVSLFLTGLAALFSYLISQLLFSVVIMDHMSRITELKVTGHIREEEKVGAWKLLFHLIRQEIPRTLLPVLLSVLLMILGWLTPLGPVLLLVSSGLTVAFLAWDYTDLIPARNKIPFKARFRSFLKASLFHLGFGLPFLIPVLNILFLSFAPVGATLYYLDRHRSKDEREEGGRPMAHVVLILILALLAASGCSKNLLSRGPHPEKQWTCDIQADEAMNRQDYDESILLHQRLLEIDPANALALYHLGYAYGQLRDHAKETSCYEKAIALGLRKDDIFFNLGMAYGEMDQIENAVGAFKRALDLYPNSANDYFGLAMAYQKSGHSDHPAEEAFLKAIELDPGLLDARLFLSLLYADKGELSKAADQLRKLLEMDPSHPMARQYLEKIEAE